jgi:hypothetical protein
MAKRGSHKFDLKQFEPLQLLLSQKTLPSDHGRFKHAYDPAMLKLPKYTHESHESKKFIHQLMNQRHLLVT